MSPTNNQQQQKEDGPYVSLSRRRTALACTTCRTRKSRCNGVRPRCSSCQRMGFDCVYEEPPSASNVIIDKDHFINMKSRLQALEELVKRHDDHLNNVSSTNGPGNAAESDNRNSSPEVLCCDAVTVNLQPHHHKNQEDMSDEPDGMAISLVGDSSHSYFGPSSNITLMRTIFQAIARQNCIPDQPAFPPTSVANIPVIEVFEAEFQKTSKLPINTSHLPPQPETEQLLQHFFSTTGVLFPYIHKASFMQSYQSLKQQNFRGKVRRTWLALLNVMLAMATCESSQGNSIDASSAAKSHVFYQRAQELYDEQMLQGTTLETVQYLLLASQYLQGTQKAMQTWITHGLAVKAALSIGLHAPGTSAAGSAIEDEIRKRTWYGCVILDRTLSMTYGRPSTIPEDYNQLELPVAMETDAGGEPSVEFFTATITLYRLLWRIMAELYGHNLGIRSLSVAETITHILQLQDELSKWRQGLPAGLTLLSSSTLSDVTAQDSIAERYRFILTLRYMNMQVLLYRPLLVISLQDKAHNPASPTFSGLQWPLTDLLQADLMECCLQSAHGIIELIHGVLSREDLGTKFLGAWWFTIYYSFNAGLVVFGAMAAREINGTHDVERLNGTKLTLGKAMDGLNRLGRGNALVDRCIICITRLIRVIEDWIMHPRTNNGRTNEGNKANQVMPMVGGFHMAMPVSLAINETAELNAELELDPLLSNAFQQWFPNSPNQ